MTAPQDIINLVEKFDQNKQGFLSKEFNEKQVRTQFINPFFEALGWDVKNELNPTRPDLCDVKEEDRVVVDGRVKHPDYGFRISGKTKFFVEVKQPSKNIESCVDFAYQIKRYAWNAHLPLSILTDFEEFVVYYCGSRPSETKGSDKSKILSLRYDQYVEKWSEISDLFSREAVLNGSIDKYVKSMPHRRGEKEVDDSLLDDISEWREMLAKNIALRNQELSTSSLNYAVQAIIDRIMFLRICEDRDIEQYMHLKDLLSGDRVYPRLFEIFRQADERYNSGIFHFSKEPGRSNPDTITPSLIIDDKPLKDIIRQLYFPISPYEFSVLPAEILGQIYEQFLGKVIRLTPGHRAKVEYKPEVKKAGGVKYTPTYIVDYIVKETIGPLVEGKTPDEVDRICILDPACGSGSFLIVAYQYLLDWYKEWYIQNQVSVSNKKKKNKETIYQGKDGGWKLTTEERKRILVNNIYGVDIDSQAVEVTKLSLLLKVLEGENDDTLSRQMKLFHERVLPDLGNNIKCGNSLISWDILKDNPNLTNDEIERINPFDWNRGFPDIMDRGGFDAVIGNPPYVRQEGLGEFKAYFQKHYQVYHGIADLYTYFIEMGVSLLLPRGIFSYIVSNKWMRANYGQPLRVWLKGQHIEEIVDFGDLQVFQKATTYPCILRISKETPHDSFEVAQMKTLTFSNLSDYVKEHRYQVKQSDLDDAGWSLVDESVQRLLEKLRWSGMSLGDYVEGKLYYGIKTGLNKAFVIDEDTRANLIAEDPKSEELIWPFLVGRDIKRYQPPTSDKYLILIPKGWTQEKSNNGKNALGWFRRSYPAIANHLTPFAEAAQKRYDKGEYWWELRTCDYYDVFEEPKIIWPGISAEVAAFAFDDNRYYGNDNNQLIISDDLYLLGILNSHLMRFLLKSICDKVQGGFYRLKIIYIAQLPIRPIDFSDPQDVVHHDQIVGLVDRMLDLNKQLTEECPPHEKTRLQSQIDYVDRQIDDLVYELYDLTEDEIKLVIESTI